MTVGLKKLTSFAPRPEPPSLSSPTTPSAHDSSSSSMCITCPCPWLVLAASRPPSEVWLFWRDSTELPALALFFSDLSFDVVRSWLLGRIFSVRPTADPADFMDFRSPFDRLRFGVSRDAALPRKAGSCTGFFAGTPFGKIFRSISSQSSSPTQGPTSRSIVSPHSVHLPPGIQEGIHSGSISFSRVENVLALDTSLIFFAVSGLMNDRTAGQIIVAMRDEFTITIVFALSG
mmetsp:Transcript_22089/g.55697  ORF Transcript_22089/g.55697 Transcript_22089/m.55697 type:complete len:232 (-) Transcript_22089:67-762(-)